MSTVRLARSFALPVPPDRAFAVLTDAEQLVDVVPGATLTRWDGETFDATARLRLGLVRLIGHGVGRVIARDPVARTVVVEVTTRGGRWVAEVAATVGEDSTVDVVADVLVPAAAGRLGRLLVTDVGNRMFDEATAALVARLGGAQVPAVAETDGHVGVPQLVTRALGRPRAAAAAVAGAAAVTAGVTVGVLRHVRRRL